MTWSQPIARKIDEWFWADFQDNFQLDVSKRSWLLLGYFQAYHYLSQAGFQISDQLTFGILLRCSCQGNVLLTSVSDCLVFPWELWDKYQ